MKYSNRRYFLYLMMIQYLPPGLKQILNYFIGLGLKFFDAKEITIRQLHQNLLSPSPTPHPPKKGGSYMKLWLSCGFNHIQQEAKANIIIMAFEAKVK